MKRPQQLPLVTQACMGCLAACWMVALGSQAYAAGNLDDSNLRNDFVYNSNSGNVQLHVPDFVGTGAVIQFSLGTDDAFNLDDGFVIQGLDCGLILPAVACGDERAISYSDPTDEGFEGVFELGRILPTGLSGPEVQGFLTEASYRTTATSAAPEFDIHVVPEPSGRLGILLGVVVLFVARRSRIFRIRIATA